MRPSRSSTGEGARPGADGRSAVEVHSASARDRRRPECMQAESRGALEFCNVSRGTGCDLENWPSGTDTDSLTASPSGRRSRSGR